MNERITPVQYVKSGFDLTLTTWTSNFFSWEKSSAFTYRCVVEESPCSSRTCRNHLANMFWLLTTIGIWRLTNACLHGSNNSSLKDPVIHWPQMEIKLFMSIFISCMYRKSPPWACTPVEEGGMTKKWAVRTISVVGHWHKLFSWMTI